ncbi:MAG: methylmalonyl Co-A mutase-associated GTPase MeaB, partial [Bacteroidetes bacterium]|nr:methylmalonyl Co-A mutase-associated GTPase MeaB [Bacteroidota bacterium]
DKQEWLLAEKAYHIIQQNKMKSINKNELKTQIEQGLQHNDFNLYSFVKKYF